MARVAAVRRWSTGQEWNPLRVVFHLFTSVRFAVAMVLAVAAMSLLGVVFPQAPDPVRANPAAYDAWMQEKATAYGIFAGWMRRAGLFEVFHTPWFNGLFFILLASVAVCTFNRWAPTWRSVRRPVRRVNDRYFERAHARAAVATTAAAGDVEALLRSRYFKVARVDERDGAVYLFAERFSWAALATFLTHASLILFMAGGIVSALISFSTGIDVAEGATAPVFPVLSANQLQVENLRSVEGRDAEGRIVDYHTDLVIFRNGREICRGTTTVNNPLACAGYRFHQAAYSGDGVALRVRDARTGATVYAETPVLSRQPAFPSPHVQVRDAAGALLFDDYVVMSPVDDRRSLALVPVNGLQKVLPVVLSRSGDNAPWQLSVVHLRDRGDPNDQDYQVTMSEGGVQRAGGLQFAFPDLRGLPSLIVQGIPGIDPIGLMQLVTERDGSLVLDIQNPARTDSPAARLALPVGEPVTAGDYTYTFEGPRALTGVLVRRDPGSWFIWAATAAMIVGLAITFYVPRRRLWLRVTTGRVDAAGIAERTAHLSDELQRLLARLPNARPAPGSVMPEEESQPRSSMPV